MIAETWVAPTCARCGHRCHLHAFAEGFCWDRNCDCTAVITEPAA